MMMMKTVLIIAMMIMTIKCEEKQLEKNSMPKQIEGKEKILDMLSLVQINKMSGVAFFIVLLCLYST